MEQVMVRTRLEEHSHPKRFTAEYVRSNGERIQIATRQRSSTHARGRIDEVVSGVRWEQGIPELPFLDVGQGWIDEPELGPLPTSA
jgi:hypothetical protein